MERGMEGKQLQKREVICRLIEPIEPDAARAL
jgi:hypothetical protein